MLRAHSPRLLAFVAAVAGLVLCDPATSLAQKIVELIDTTGDGSGNVLQYPEGLAVDESGNVYVAGRDTDNVFKITPAGVITELIDGTGDGGGNVLVRASYLAVDGATYCARLGGAAGGIIAIDHSEMSKTVATLDAPANVTQGCP